ncbi:MULTISPECIES: helix-turn-helix domain-containing protein [unclassified Curtobacterium]|uniref:helix-turn-helix domain-containing protein n=1 Tax=unclassified Curtobacterium TaxID=257496 RepID=UPI000D8E768D|nr:MULTISPECIES: helix-turn-helix domain-containing protein [unclassified Curtobacterium]PYY39007.1 ArsR family transcriptional regulator [Curtobacterium sp. MCPF17_046]WIB16033.1 helix-turn-helix domain-containing protein [Curtobacterium sp. MCPF17_050]
MASRDTPRSTLTDAASMRVLAHPTRLRLLGLLRERGPQTAAQLGDVVDEAPGTVSYHLSKLAASDLIQAAEPQSADRRERWWQAAAPLTSWEPADLLDDPARLSASAALEKSIVQANAARYLQYVDARPALPREWVTAAAGGDRAIRLTVTELAALRAELESVVDRWVDVGAAHSPDVEDGAETIVLAYHAYRHPGGAGA